MDIVTNLAALMVPEMEMAGESLHGL